MTIHKEGRTLLLLALAGAIVLNIMVRYFAYQNDLLQNLVLAGSLILLLLFLQFFRSPKVVTPKDDQLVYAPADGKVVVIEETREEEFLKENRRQISIFMSPINVHVNRMPVAGLIKYFCYHAGKYLVAWHPKSSTENERTTLVVENPNGILILIRQIAGAMARRIKCYASEGERLAQGQEFGFIKFGSRVDVFLPLDAEIRVAIGDKTTAGKTVLAKLS